MMEISGAQIFSVIWLGILTSISPCPLTTNIAATSYIGQQIHSRFATVFAAVAYTIGRTLCYMAINLVVVTGLISIPGVSYFLQTHMNRILGPLLFITGLFILGLIPLRMPSFSPSTEKLQKLGKSGFLGAVLLGFLFAMSFCPVSAGLFFGSVIPLSLKCHSRLFLPFLYGIGTALPVIGVAFVMAYSTRIAGIFLDRLSRAERWLRRITGSLFILIGVYFCLKYIFHLINF
jgi:cytochrome c-type biogenesis protein